MNLKNARVKIVRSLYNSEEYVGKEGTLVEYKITQGIGNYFVELGGYGVWFLEDEIELILKS
jgi:hypothetical protein